TAPRSTPPSSSSRRPPHSAGRRTWRSREEPGSSGLEGLDELLTLRVPQRAGRDQDDVDQVPDAAAARRQELREAEADVPEVEAVDAEVPEEDREEERDEPLLAPLEVRRRHGRDGRGPRRELLERLLELRARGHRA